MRKTFIQSLSVALIATASLPIMAEATTVQGSGLTIDLNNLVVGEGPDAQVNDILSRKKMSLSNNVTNYSAQSVANPTGVPASTGASSQGTQMVFLDFDSATTGTYTRSWKENADGTGATITRDFAEHIYTAPERETIRVAMQKDYGKFDVKFTTNKPDNGEFSTLFFNANMPGEGNGVVAGIRVAHGGRINGILWGAADNIDFRNLNRTDRANIDGNFWGVISDNGFKIVTGMDATPVNRVLAIIRQSATTGSHELGHDLGMRHHEAWGPLRTGLPTTGTPANGRFAPVYTGPRGANETTDHLMVSGASGGSSLAGSVTKERFFGLRAATKLAFNEKGVVVKEADGNVITLEKLDVPRTLEKGRDKDNRIAIAAISIEGRISEVGETDTYTFNGVEGDIFNFELISWVNSNNKDFIDGVLKIFDMNHNLLAWNDDEFEGVDSFLFDFVLDFTGQFLVEVSSLFFMHPVDTVDGNFGVGNYQLFATRTHIPAPGIIGLMVLGLAAGFGLSRRRKQVM